MQAILSVIGFVLIGAGVVVGLVSFFSPGQVVIGLNLGVAATLLVGGCIVAGLSALIATVRDLAEALSRPAVPFAADHFEPIDATFAAAAAVAAAEVTQTAAVAATTATADASDLPVPDEVVDAAISEQAMDAATADEAPEAPAAIDAAREHASNEVSEIPLPLEPVNALAGDQYAEPEIPADSSHELAGDDTSELTQTAEAAPDDGVVATALDDGDDTVDGQSDADSSVEEVEAGPCAPSSEDAEQPETVDHDVVSDIDRAVDDLAATAVATGDEIAAAADDLAKPEVHLHAVRDADAGTDGDVEPSDHGAAPESDYPIEEQQVDEQVTAPNAEPDGSPQEALYVLEETTVRRRPARLLSDGTVEAETDAGWMRFENMEHLNEYLDAMSA